MRYDHDEALAVLARIPEGYTEGPWEWFGNLKVRSVYLATKHSGRRFVMQFERWGMQGAAPRFQHVTKHLMYRFERWANKERDYRADIRGIDHPDAILIALAPDLATNLTAAVERVGELEATLEGYSRYGKCECGDEDVCMLTLDRQRAAMDRDENGGRHG